MTPDQVVKFYGTLSEAARKIGVKPSAVWQWINKGAVPLLRQADIQLKTRGRLRAEKS